MAEDTQGATTSPPPGHDASSGQTGCDGPRQPVIGFIAPNVYGYFFGSLLTGVIDTANAHGARVMAIQTHDAGFQDFGSDRFDAPVAWDHLDALIVSQAAVDGDYLREFAANGRPVVTLYEAPSGFDAPTVVPDNVRGVRAAVDHLIEHGHTEIAFVGREPANADDAIRYQAYCDALTAHGLTPSAGVPVPWRLDEIYDGASAVRHLQAMPTPPTAVVACTDATAMALVAALTDVGLSVPDDIAVVGFDDIAEAAEFRPPLSTVAQSFALTGAAACELALRGLAGEQVPAGLHTVPTTFVVRESCGCHPAEPADVPGRASLAGVTSPFVIELAQALYGDRVPTNAQQGRLRVAVQHLAALFSVALRAPEADLTATGRAAAEALRNAAAPSRDPLNALPAVRDLAAAVAAHVAPGDHAAALTLQRRALDFATRALQSQRRPHSTAVVNQHVEIQRRNNAISTDLVRRGERDVRSLEWLSGSDVRIGSLVVRDESGELRLAGVYPPGAAGGRRDEPCDLRAFPPADVVRASSEQGDDLLFLLPVRSDGSDHGFLALSGQFDVFDEAVFERFNHWAVLLAVALDQDRAVERLRASEERYALAAEAARDGLLDWDVTSGTVYYSSRWKELLGFTEPDLGTTPEEWLRRVHPADRPHVDATLDDHLRGTDASFEIEYRLRTADGTYRWMVTSAKSVRDAEGQVTRIVGAMTDVTERRELEDRLRHEAHYDLLTGLPNRALFLERLERAIVRTRRHPEYRFAVVFMDLDGFKVVNDSLGHQVGDELLVEVSKRLQSEVRAGDTVSRFGGDEFALLIEDIQDIAGLPDVIRRLLSVMSVPMVLTEGARTVSAAAGVAVSDAGYTTPDEYLRDADTAMYRAKAEGPGSVVLFDPAMHARAMARLQLESALDRGIAQDQFELFYQPILQLDTRRVVGLEALIRWQHPTRGLVPPDEFLPVAEATGQTRQIGTWTITETCRQIREWLDTVPGFDACTVSVNLSNRQFWDPDLRPTLRAALDRYRVPASSVVFEVTEGVIMDNQDVAVSFLRQLREEGVGLHVDDFGTGHSSLSALHELPVGALKIDRSFVQRMQASPRSRELVGLMVTMGSRFGLSVIAEGVETEEDAAVLAELGCPLVQGYLFSRPVRASEITHLLLSRDAGLLRLTSSA